MGTQRGAALPVLPGKPRAFNPSLGVRRKRTAGCGFCSELRALGRMNRMSPCLLLGHRLPASHSPVYTPRWWPFWALCKLFLLGQTVPLGPATRGPWKGEGGRRRAAGTRCRHSRALRHGDTPAVPLCPAAAAGLNFPPLAAFPGAASLVRARSGWLRAREQGPQRCAGGFDPRRQTHGLTGPLSNQGSRLRCT